MRSIFGVSWTKVGTVVSLLVTILSLDELGNVVPEDWMPGIVIAINALMGVKKFLLPSERFKR